jgi:hypothetical protein
MAARRSTSTRNPPGPALRATPSATWATIASGTSERGLSEVTTATSASRPAISPMSGRLARSRSPPQPKTTITRPSVTALAARSRLSRESGVWA